MQYHARSHRDPRSNPCDAPVPPGLAHEIQHAPTVVSRSKRRGSPNRLLNEMIEACDEGIGHTNMYLFTLHNPDHYYEKAWLSLHRSDALLALLPLDVQCSHVCIAWAALLSQALADLEAL